MLIIKGLEKPCGANNIIICKTDLHVITSWWEPFKDENWERSSLYSKNVFPIYILHPIFHILRWVGIFVFALCSQLKECSFYVFGQKVLSRLKGNGPCWALGCQSQFYQMDITHFGILLQDHKFLHFTTRSQGYCIARKQLKDTESTLSSLSK